MCACCPNEIKIQSEHVVTENESIAWFQNMVFNALEYARGKKQQGHPIVGILCEYTPREIIMAAGAVPVCLCGGSAEMIPAAEAYLPNNLCPLIKSTFGFSVNQANPFLEMADLLIAETTCDGKKKMYELLAERHPMLVLELPQKSHDEDALDQWRRELKKLKQTLEDRYKVEITEKKLRESIQIMNSERKLRRELAGLMQEKNPPLTGHELLDMKSLISGIPADFELYEKALNSLPGRVPIANVDSRVRVLLTGVPLPHGAERVLGIIESVGGLVVCQENCTGLKPIWDDVDENAEDLMEAIADKYYHIPCSVLTDNQERLDLLESLISMYNPHCVIELTWQACLTYDVESYGIKHFVEDECGLPYMQIETDYSPSDTARITTRVEALFEMVKGNGRMKSRLEET